MLRLTSLKKGKHMAGTRKGAHKKGGNLEQDVIGALVALIIIVTCSRIFVRELIELRNDVRVLFRKR